MPPAAALAVVAAVPLAAPPLPAAAAQPPAADVAALVGEVRALRAELAGARRQIDAVLQQQQSYVAHPRPAQEPEAGEAAEGAKDGQPDARAAAEAAAAGWAQRHPGLPVSHPVQQYGTAAWDRAAAAATPRGPAACPAALNTTAWVERVAAPPVVRWVPAQAADVVLRRAGALQAQDDQGVWFNFVATARHSDGTYAGTADDLSPGSERALRGQKGEHWPKVWLQFLRARRESPAAAAYVDVARSACADLPPACAAGLTALHARRIDRRCAESLPAAVWANPRFAAAMPDGVLTWGLRAEACGRLGAASVARMQCDAAPLSAGCAEGLAPHALRRLAVSCVGSLGGGWFRAAKAERVAAVIQGTGAPGLTADQLGAIPQETCAAVTGDWAPFRRLGAYGADLCAALPRACWVARGESQVDTEAFPAACLTQLPPDSIRDLSHGATVGKVGPDAAKLCDLGHEVLAAQLSAAQRRALAPEMCPGCLNEMGGSRAFPQCATAAAARAAAEWEGKAAVKASTLAATSSFTGGEQLLLAGAAAAAFAAAAALSRRSRAAAL